MFSKLLNTSVRYSFIPFSSFFRGHDEVLISQLKIDPDEIKETGWDRIKKMYTIDEFGQITPEVNSILQVGMMSVFFGGLYGGFINSKHAYEDFMINNTATSFKSHLEAKKQLQDHVTTNFAKGAFRWSWRLAFFSMSLMAITSTIQVYRNKYGVTEYVVAGGMAGALYKFKMGPKAWVSGGVIGSTLGLLGGAVTIGLLKIAGISMQDAHAWRYKIRDSKMELKKKTLERQYTNEDFAIVKLHDDNIGESGHSIEALDKEKTVTS